MATFSTGQEFHGYGLLEIRTFESGPWIKVVIKMLITIFQVGFVLDGIASIIKKVMI
jgi:TRAP-type mannitol/chloroaromatic compound transport system permease small subunit